MQKFSFLSVTTDNSKETFRLLLESIASLYVPPDAAVEVLVYDQSESKYIEFSSDNIKFKYFHNPGLISLSKARNNLLQHVSTGYVLFSDDDAYYPTDFIFRIFNSLNTFPAEALFYFKLLNYGTADCYGNRVYPSCTKRVLPLRAIHNCISLNICLPVSAIKRVGCFDERLGVGADVPCGEETDLVIKLLGILPVIYLDAAFCFHPAFISSASRKKQLVYLAGYRRMLFINKRSVFMSVLLFFHLCFLMCGYLLKSILHPNSIPHNIVRVLIIIKPNIIHSTKFASFYGASNLDCS